MAENILVIGGSGFVGSHVADELTNLGHEVTIFDHTKSKYIQENQKMVIGEITDYDSIEKIISKNQIVYHFAGIAGILDASNDPINTVKNNILATTYILEACKNNKIERYLKIIDEIEKVRSKNNVNWMNILRLAIKTAPDEAREIMTSIDHEDNRISELVKKLSE